MSFFPKPNIFIGQVHSLLLKMLVAGLDQQLICSVISLSHSVVPHKIILSDLITEALNTSLMNIMYVIYLLSIHVAEFFM